MEIISKSFIGQQ